MPSRVSRAATNDSDFFKWIGEALFFGKQTSDSKSALTEASAASPYLQEGDDERAIRHLQRAATVDPLFLPAASTLIGLYGKQGEPAQAAELSVKIRTAMSERSDVNQTTPEWPTSDAQKKTEDVFKNIQVLKGVPSEQLIPAMQFMSCSMQLQPR